MKIICWGDSLVWGVYGGDFVAQAAARLPEHQLVNRGAGGLTALNLLWQLDETLAEAPDGVLLMVGGNDAISYSQPQTRLYYAQVRGLPEGAVTPTAFASAYRDLLARLQLAGVLVWAALEPIEYNPPTQAALRQFNALAAEAARAQRVPVLDLMAELAPDTVPDRPALTLADINLIGRRAAAGWSDYETERRRGGFTYSFDGIHFTPQTAAQVGARVAAFLSAGL